MASALSPADETARFVALRQPQVVGDKANRLRLPERTLSNKSVRGSHVIRMLILEIFSGCGELTAVLKAACFGVSAPMDAHPAKSIYVPEHDLLRPSVVKHLEALFVGGLFLLCLFWFAMFVIF